MGFSSNQRAGSQTWRHRRSIWFHILSKGRQSVCTWPVWLWFCCFIFFLWLLRIPKRLRVPGLRPKKCRAPGLQDRNIGALELHSCTLRLYWARIIIFAQEQKGFGLQALRQKCRSSRVPRTPPSPLLPMETLIISLGTGCLVRNRVQWKLASVDWDEEGCSPFPSLTLPRLVPWFFPTKKPV